MNRNVTFNACVCLNNKIGFICDSNGYITCVEISEEKMLAIQKIDNSSI